MEKHSMVQLSESSASAFLHRFQRFEDAILRSVGITVQPNQRQCELVIEAPDRESLTGWSLVTFRIHDLKVIHLDRTTHFVELLRCGLQILFHSDSVYLFLDANYDDESMPDPDVCMAYLMGDAIQWEANHYSGGLDG